MSINSWKKCEKMMYLTGTTHKIAVILSMKESGVILEICKFDTQIQMVEKV